jgi:hypothetical protein
VPLQQRDRGQRVNNIAERARLDDENVSGRLQWSVLGSQCSERCSVHNDRALRAEHFPISPTPADPPAVAAVRLR